MLSLRCQNDLIINHLLSMKHPLSALASDISRHILWSDRLMYDALAQIPEAELNQERPSLFRNMLHSMNHMVVINHIWQCHLLGQSHPYSARNTSEYPALAEMRERHLGLDQWYVNWFEGLDPDSLTEAIDYELIGGQPGRMSRLQILMHIAMHTHYHRGYVADMIYQVQGHRPPVMDLPVFYRENPASFPPTT
jgi:uncharacterized damage-inducible protein DinB